MAIQFKLSVAVKAATPLMIGCLYVFYIFSSLSDKVPNAALLPEERGHLQVKINPNIVKKDTMFMHALRDVHHMLADRRDVITEFDTRVFEQRKRHISTVCSFMKNKEFSPKQFQRIAYYKRIDVGYCHVAKVATKFLFRMFHSLNSDDHISSFDFSSARMPREHITVNTVHSSVKVIFSRDPYRRVYSTYIDKFVSPNSFFWSLMGKHIKSHSRKSEVNTTYNCGHDVTFGELVKYLIDHNIELYNNHFIPVSAVCDVCNIHYDIIGKVETFKHDSMYIINRTQSENSSFIIKDFKEESNIHNIIFKVNRAFTLKKGSLKCINDHAVHLRLWRVLQIGGLIDKNDTYPLSPEQSRKANVTTVINLMLSAYHRTEPNSNVKEALLQAYSQVSSDHLQQLRLKYMKEFMLFGYEDSPSYLFDKNAYVSVKNNNFDYFDVLRL